MTVPVLDAGALVALERNDRSAWAVLELAASRSIDVVVPSTALAQVGRGTRRQALLGKALDHCVIADFDSRAREVGVLCGHARTSDICDAHVAIVAATVGDVLLTSDVDDLDHLLRAYGKQRPVLVRC